MADPDQPYFTVVPFWHRGNVQHMAACGVCGRETAASTEALAIAAGCDHLRQYHPRPPADPRPEPQEGTP